MLWRHGQRIVRGICWATLLGGVFFVAGENHRLAAQEGDAIFASPAAPYVPDAPVKGTIKIVGSDTMQPIAEHWARGLARFHPEAKFQFDCRGSETAIDALPKSESIVALMSRPLSDGETEQLKQAGATVVGLEVGQDALAIIVNPANSLRQVTREQLQAVYSTTPDAVATWAALGLAGEWEKLLIKPQGRDADSVSRRTFRAWLLDQGQAERKVAEFLTNAEVADAVAEDKQAIGYVTRTAAGDKVKIVPLKLAEEDPAVAPTDEAVARGLYPLVRNLHIVVRHSAAKPISGLQLEFVRYALSRGGQADVVKDGFLPLSRTELNAQLDRLGWNTNK
jgi:ABC-type phosphate transport system, periplasmic component